MSRSGLWSQLAYKAPETSYGNAAPTYNRWLEFQSEDIKLDRAYIDSNGLRAGRMFQSSARSVPTTRQAAGSITLEVPNQHFGGIVNLLHGNTVTPVQQGSTAAYLQTHNIGTTAPWGKSAAVQIGKPDVGGTVRPFNYLGGKLLGAKFSSKVGDLLVATLDWDFQDENVASPVLATPAYPASLRSFNFTQGTIQFDGGSAGNVLSADLDINVPHATDRFFYGASGLKAEPIVNAYAAATATLSVEFSDLTTYNKFVNGTNFAVTLDFQGPLIAGSYYERFKVTLAACQARGETPNVDGPDVLALNVPIRVLDDGTNPPVKIEITSTETTL